MCLLYCPCNDLCLAVFTDLMILPTKCNTCIYYLYFANHEMGKSGTGGVELDLFISLILRYLSIGTWQFHVCHCPYNLQITGPKLQ